MRHTTNKRGFTLTELMLVIAIIVILAGAVTAGIAIDLNRYKDHLASLTTDEGESAWELSARSEVAGIFGAAASDNAIAKASQSAAAESSIAAAAAASASAAAVKASDDAVAASAAAVSDAAVSASAAAATTAGSTTAAAATTQSAGGGGGGRVGSTTGTTAVPGSSCGGGWSNCWNCSFNIGAEAKEFTIYVPYDGVTGLSCNTGNCTVTGSGHYWTVTMTYGTANSNSFGLSGNVSGSWDMSQVKIVSYVPA